MNPWPSLFQFSSHDYDLEVINIICVENLSATIWTWTVHFINQHSFSLLSLGCNNSAGGLLVIEFIIRPVVSVLALPSLIRYICYWNSQFLNNVIIIKTKVLLNKAYVTLATISANLFRCFGLLAPKTFNIIWLSDLSTLSVPD